MVSGDHFIICSLPHHLIVLITYASIALDVKPFYIFRGHWQIQRESNLAHGLMISALLVSIGFLTLSTFDNHVGGRQFHSRSRREKRAIP